MDIYTSMTPSPLTNPCVCLPSHFILSMPHPPCPPKERWSPQRPPRNSLECTLHKTEVKSEMSDILSPAKINTQLSSCFGKPSPQGAHASTSTGVGPVNPSDMSCTKSFAYIRIRESELCLQGRAAKLLSNTLRPEADSLQIFTVTTPVYTSPVYLSMPLQNYF